MTNLVGGLDTLRRFAARRQELPMNLYRRPEMCVANKQRKTSLLQNEANKLFVFKRELSKHQS
jgi:hypothetical protein